MKRYWIFLSLLALWAHAHSQERSAKTDPKGTFAHPAIMTVTLDPQTVTLLHLRAGYVSSVRMPEEVSSVVLGDPSNFRAEHSESEPRMVFIKPISSRSTETNVLITTISGRSVSLHLVNDAKAGPEEQIDFVLNYEPERTLLIQPTVSTFLVPDSATKTSDTSKSGKRDPEADELRLQQSVAKPSWQGKELLKVAIGRLTEDLDGHKLLAFSVLNTSHSFVELLTPQLVLVGPGPGDHKRKSKAEPLACTDFRLLPGRRLPPGGRADGVLLFERPGFKESTEGVFLQIAQADQVDHPVQIPIPFTSAAEGGPR
jgi:hypothetical protein